MHNFLRSMNRTFPVIASLALVTSIVHHANAISVNSGDVLAVDFIYDNLLHINPDTGFRTVITGKSHGAGAEIGNILGVAVSKTGHIYLGDQTKQSIYRVDPLTGDRTVISSPTLGSGPLIGAPVDIAFNAQGQLIVANQSGLVDSVLSIDPLTGDRTLLSGVERGAGPTFQVAGRLRLDGDQIFLTTGSPESSLFQIDSVTGNRKIISGGDIGSGPTFSLPIALHLKTDGNFLVGDWGRGAIYSVNPLNGERTFVAGSSPGTTYPLNMPTALAATDAGLLYVCDRINGILTLDLQSGEFTNFSVRDSSYGETFREFAAMTIVPQPVPEPATGMFTFSALVAMGVLRSRSSVARRPSMNGFRPARRQRV